MRIIIAGGGTGGHIYPGISLAREFLKRNSDAEILFVGTKKGLENMILPREGLPLKRIWVGGLMGRFSMRKIVSFFKLPIGLLQSLALLLRHRPDMVIGVGGYVAGPVVLCASLLRIPIVIQEQNLVPGFTNKVLGRFADRIAVSFHESREYFPADRVVFTGNPVRREILEKLKESSVREDRGFFTVFVFGGSQGALNINNALCAALDFLEDYKGSLRIIHQTGRGYEEQMKEGYRKKGFQADVRPFIYNIVDIYKEADLIICRAGATTVSELMVAGRASILIPLPTAAANHQEMNARRLKDAGAAEMILEKDLSGESLAEKIVGLIEKREKLKDMEKKIRAMAVTDAAERIVDICFDVLKERKGFKALAA
jgi:UDP-N-acetylglucosamine--N-acetylmuramyl-(pentapeptide) pyrophosphoryl-undecaprenol N-acetylglucosamine transferase